MSRDFEKPRYSINDILNVLSRSGSDETYEAMSELTGLSIEQLYQMQQGEKIKMVVVGCRVREVENKCTKLSEEELELLRKGSIEPVREVAKRAAKALVEKIEKGKFSVQLSVYDNIERKMILDDIIFIDHHAAGEADFDSFRQKKVYDIDWCADNDEMVDFAPPKEAYVDASLTDDEIYSDLEERYGLPVNGFLCEI